MTHSAPAAHRGKKTLDAAAAPGPVPPAPIANPYPGLAAFKPEGHRLFFGRDDDSQRVVDRLAKTRLISVVGRSGTGKSSLVAAGVVPRLAEQIENLSYLRFEPQGSPFQQLADALCRQWSGVSGEAAEATRAAADRLQRLLADAAESPQVEEQLAAASFDLLGQWGRPVLLLVDQAEDLFTHTSPASALRFRQLCARLLELENLHVVLTLRSEFTARLLEWLGEDLFRASLVALEAIRSDEQLEAIITGPAGACSVPVQPELVTTLLSASSATKGALPLIALTLEQLFEQRDTEHGLTLDAYRRMGGLESIVASAASGIERLIDSEPELELACGRLFAELATVIDELPTRRAAAIEPLRADRQVARLVDALRRQGFLSDPDDQHVELAHETLLGHWPRLRRWCARYSDSLSLSWQAKQAAREWQKAVDHDELQSAVAQTTSGHLLRWSWERQKPALLALLELSHRPAVADPDFHDPGVEAWRALAGKLEEPLRDFLRPEPLQLLDQLAADATQHHRREEIGLRLNQMGDPRRGVGLAANGLPDMVWVDVPAGEVHLEGRGSELFRVQPFRISRYAVTWLQYNAFLNADDGYHDRRWWRKLVQRKQPGEERWSFQNHPVIHVSWSDAVAFCRWLSERRHPEGPDIVRLPTEWEWQWVAQGRGEMRKYPWAGDWNPMRANSHESGAGRTMAVGMYPLGAPDEGMVADLAGNVWEWCLNEYHLPRNTQIDGDNPRALRGGSWLDFPGDLRAAKRDYFPPGDRDGDIGFRVVLGASLEQAAGGALVD